MSKEKSDYSFWVKYKRFASTEIMLYLIMIVGILLGIFIFS
jgi:intracellular septation protein A